MNKYKILEKFAETVREAFPNKLPLSVDNTTIDDFRYLQGQQKVVQFIDGYIKQLKEIPED